MKKARPILVCLIPLCILGLFFATSLTSFAATKANSTSAVTPNIGVGSCIHFDYLEIVYENGAICYSGNGYAGVSLANVSQINPGNNCGWVRLYTSGAPAQNLTFNSWQDQSILLRQGASNLITQVHIQGQNCSGRAP